MIRIFIVSAISLYREGLSALLGCRDGIVVAGGAADESEAVATLRRSRHPAPDVLLMDMSAANSATATRRLMEQVPDAAVFAITVPNCESEVVACAELGVAGFVTTDASLNELVVALESVARGDLLCSPAAAGALLRRVATLAQHGSQGDSLALLTDREREVVGLIADGLSNKQIADSLYIELATARNHVHNIYGKLGVHRRTEAAALIRGFGARPMSWS
jgi:two-component system, NarL family, nitrate/nitrite response regulator NarL